VPRFIEAITHHPLRLISILVVVVAFFVGLIAIRLGGHEFDVWSLVRATTVLSLSIAWLFLRWRAPRRP